MSYDYTVLAGTQGLQNHRKKDRMFELAERLRLPGRRLHRRRWRPSGRHRRHRSRRARLHGVQPVRQPQRARTSRRDQLRPVLRGQRLAARLRGRRHRHGGLEHRDGRSRDDRRRRPRRVPSRRGRADVGAGAERRRRHRRRRRGRSGARSRSSTSPTSRDRSPSGTARISDCSGRRSPRTGCASTTSDR